MTVPVPVSGEDQPDPRVPAVHQLWLSGEHCSQHGWPEPVSDYDCPRCVLAAIDSADRAAGIRRVTEQQVEWCAPRLSHAADMLSHIKWDTAEDAAINERLMNTLRAGSQGIRGLREFPPAAALVPVQEDRP